MKPKIIATIGPATWDKENLAAVIDAGVNTIRFNYSHITHDKSREVLDILSEIDPDNKVEKLADLSGPKIRVTNPFPEEGQKFQANEEIEITLTEGSIYKSVNAGERIFIDDGIITLEIIESTDTHIVARTQTACNIKPRKGVNFPDSEINMSCITEKDHNDLNFICQNNFDLVAASFIQSAEDMAELKSEIKKRNQDHKYKVIGKIERPQAVQNIDAIIEETDLIMIARGDLGVEIPFEEVPKVEKEITAKANAKSKPVIHATQVMASMETNIRPTRAEVTDAFFAIENKCSYIMLSGETSTGQFPVETIQALKQIIDFNYEG